MASDIWNIVLNVVASFIYAFIIWLWQKRAQKPSKSPVKVARPVEEKSSHTGDHRQKNRAALNEAAHQFLFYLVTFGALYLSITLPPLFKALTSKEVVLLSQARVIGDYLPNYPIGKEYLQLAFFVAAAVFYWPLLAISEFLTSLVAPAVDAFVPLTRRIWSAITMLLLLLFCIPVAASSIYLFYEKTFYDALMNVLAFLVIAFIFGQAQSGKR